MPTTTNYGWTTPADTDLVKDGASAIRTLGNGVDTSLKTVSDGRGLVHINTTTMSGISSQSINNVFSSTYDNYRLVFSNLTGSGASTNIYFRLRKSGSDNSSSIYYIQYLSVNSTTVSGARVSTAQQWVIGDVRDQGPMALVCDIFNPNNASIKTNIISFDMQNSTSQPILYFAVQTHDLASSADFDGFSLIPASGTMSGTVSVYGYKK
jgi:hypothetical protein